VLVVGNKHHHQRRRRNEPVSEFVINNFALDKKLKQACTGLKPGLQWALKGLPRDEEKELIADFILNYSNESRDGMPMDSHFFYQTLASCHTNYSN
jgi:hypothetical protein